MALPALPSVGANWTPWGIAVHDAVNGAAQVADIGTPGTATGNALRAAFVPALPSVGTYTYNADGTIASDPDGNTYTWNPDGTPATQTKGGVTRTYTWNADGSLASVS